MSILETMTYLSKFNDMYDLHNGWLKSCFSNGSYRPAGGSDSGKIRQKKENKKKNC
jgi:hypothetical protein